MIDVGEALQLIFSRAEPLGTRSVPLADACGRVLAERVTADLDSPPYSKAMVDGYAVRREDLSEGPVELLVLEEITAGRTPTARVETGQASRIMTGAPIPEGADAVVMVERTELVGEPESLRVRLLDVNLPESGNILLQASVVRQGETVLSTGARIRPIEIGLLADSGRTSVQVHRHPTVAVVATGDELASPEEPITPGMIRNTNGPMLEGLAVSNGAKVVFVGVARDTEDDLRRCITAGLQADVLLLSGGVSAGVLDLAPKVLMDCGVEKIFHKVRVKPGKPIWFGAKTDSESSALVFGLPGNPVSSLVAYHLFVRPTLARLAGNPAAASVRNGATLITPFRHMGDRPTFHPGWRSLGEADEPEVAVLHWMGSADLYTMARANCLIAFPRGERQYNVGDSVRIISLD